MSEQWLTSASSSAHAGPVIDTTVAHSARMYDYWLGGKDNYAADREAGEQVIDAFPGTVAAVRANRAFLARAVRFLVAECGIRQFLDIGTGLPTASNTHEVAQSLAPECRVVYVDNDPIVLAHARALLTSSPEGATDYIDADLRNIAPILRAAARTLDLSAPVALMLLMVLHMISDAEEPHRIVSGLLSALPSGSCLVVSHLPNDVEPEAGSKVTQRLNSRMGGITTTMRSHTDVSRFFEGLDLVEPGVVQTHQWRPTDGATGGGVAASPWCGVARKR